MSKSDNDKPLPESGDRAPQEALRGVSVQDRIERLTRECYDEVVQHPGEMTPQEGEEVNRRLLQRIAQEPDLLHAMAHAHEQDAGGEPGAAGEFEYDPQTNSFRRRSPSDE